MGHGCHDCDMPNGCVCPQYQATEEDKPKSQRKKRKKSIVKAKSVAKKHDHRSSLWATGGALLWCYRCGAWTHNIPRPEGVKRVVWFKPTGLDGVNPAMKYSR